MVSPDYGLNLCYALVGSKPQAAHREAHTIYYLLNTYFYLACDLSRLQFACRVHFVFGMVSPEL